MHVPLLIGTLCLAITTGAVDPLVDLTVAKYQGLTLGNGVNQWLAVRYAAPPTGNNRFNAPRPPVETEGVQDATKEGALCVSANNQEGLQFGSTRQPMAEDCLFMGIYAPFNATVDSKLPIMFFIQGGGFSSNSNGNFNGTGLVEASGMNMMVVRINYRVGILGFIAGTAVSKDVNGAVPNNGFNDMIATARFVKEHAAQFGGDPDHIVLSGDSSGAEAIDILLAANNGTGFPDLFVGAMIESTGMGSTATAVQRDNAFNNNANSTGCLDAADPIQCMREIPIAQFQNTTTRDGWGPTIDGVTVNAPHYQMYEQGLFQKIPVIFGATSNEATPSFISNQNAETDEDISSAIKRQIPSITDDVLTKMLEAYPASLNEISFFGRNVAPRNASLRQGSGAQWQRDAAIKSEYKQQCTSAFFSDMNGMVGNKANYQYRYNILDETPGGQVDEGLFTPHTNELYAIWGTGNTDGGDPKCFAEGSCAPALTIMQAYWISFVRTLDPNTFRAAGAPNWDTWSIATPNRIVIDNEAATMEIVGQGLGEIEIAGLNQRQRCIGLIMPLSKAVAIGLQAGETIPPFANGTATDPTLSVIENGNGTAVVRHRRY
ncbi:triacylglycerol [Phlyctema vagabunda]|uniref:Carboxylic ester hydrolase n=1 Tax=Phlyctema vagabunda TaxID=108571 RepID=A0ABR4PLN0_9HELO